MDTSKDNTMEAVTVVGKVVNDLKEVFLHILLFIIFALSSTEIVNLSSIFLLNVP